jgi:hypothetical protein
MKKFLLTLSALLLLGLWTHAQDNIIRITKTQILAPDTISLDTLTFGDRTFIKLIIKNDRQNTVEIRNIKTPPGVGAAINNSVLKPKSQTELYVGFDTNFMEKTGNFVYKIVLETNLIKNIEINVKGFVKQNSSQD